MWASTKRAGRPVLYWMYPMVPWQAITPVSTARENLYALGRAYARTIRYRVMRDTKYTHTAQACKRAITIGLKSWRWVRGSPACGPVPVTTVPINTRNTTSTKPNHPSTWTETRPFSLNALSRFSAAAVAGLK